MRVLYHRHSCSRLPTSRTFSAACSASACMAACSTEKCGTCRGPTGRVPSVRSSSLTCATTPTYRARVWMLWDCSTLNPATFNRWTQLITSRSCRKSGAQLPGRLISTTLPASCSRAANIPVGGEARSVLVSPSLLKRMSADLNKTIQGLWVGPELSLMEQLSISSFLQNGHDYHLFVYDEVKNIPAGTIIRNGNEILPAARIFQYKDRPSYAGFSNFFRYKLLLERGGWWADSDTICLKAFNFSEEYVFSSEIDYRGVEVVNNGIIKVPAGSSIMGYAWKVCENKSPSKLVWGEIGPKLMA